MKAAAVQICCIMLLLVATPLVAQYPHPGLVEWGSESYTLDVGESMSFHVDWEQIPVRRWLLLVEGDLRISHLNLRRSRDGSLVYDMRDESRHAVDIPWGIGESLSGVLTAGVSGEYAISIWGPPRDDYLRAYNYDVNRALEALEDDDRNRAQSHLLSALKEHPDDVVAQTLLMGLTDAAGSGSGGVVAVAEPDSTTLVRLDQVRTLAASMRADGQFYAALDTLQQTLGAELGASGLALVYGDLTAIYLDIGNVVQAEAALAAAQSLGLAEETVSGLRERLEESR